MTIAAAIAALGTFLAPGPDTLTIHHLRHLVHAGIVYLTDLYNLSLKSANIPAVWKTATVVNLFLHDLPGPQAPGVSIASYADDLTMSPNTT